MKKFVLALAATGAFTGSALAADMAPRPYTKAPAMVAAAPSWTGCYIGAGWGYGMLDDERTTNSSSHPPSTSAAKGWLGTVGGGCDYQFNSATPFGPIVVGVFGDYDPSDIKGNYGDPFNSSHFATQKLSHAWYVGGRAGVLVTPSVLTYVSGGWTGARIDQINILNSNGSPRGLYLPQQDANGWFLGSGFEYAFTFLPVKGLFWKNEYRYSSYGSYTQNYIHSNGLPGSAAVNNSVNVQTITTSLVWRFGMPN